MLSVTVRIFDAKGVVLEKGEATRYPRKPVMWAYFVTVANPHPAGAVIKVVAMDRPGNKTKMEEKVDAVIR